ncbi:MAG TPA: FAD-dependent thymidylate synthase [Candidatus Glassbacteria bacterium]|nr:FAD-dependent thymidylate synthase [Candidatus Glassbacteria bacterium]
MNVTILNEYGYEEALLGISLSRDQPINNMPIVAEKLSGMDGGHNKFLEFISVWVDITAPRFWWQQMATYRIGNSWQSESTMYTLINHDLRQIDFEKEINSEILKYLNKLISEGKFELLKNALPEGFLQRRIMVANYKSLRNIYKQRSNHKLYQWQYFCNYLEENLEHPKFITN